jgi:hypothetical protein
MSSAFLLHFAPIAKGYLNRQNRRQNRPGEMNGMAERHKKASPHGLWCSPVHVAFVMQPLKLQGATGSTVAPTAIR